MLADSSHLTRDDMVNIMNTQGYDVFMLRLSSRMSFHFHSITLTGKEIGKDVLKRREGFLFKNFHFIKWIMLRP
jgi:hypothetical protein